MLEHPKTKRLARKLGTISGVAFGLVSTIIDRANEYAREGAFSVDDLEDALDSGGWLELFSVSEVVGAMLDCRWLDTLDDGRYYLHDFHEHAEDSTKIALMRNHRYFASGVRPMCTRLKIEERAPLDRWFDSHPFEGCAQNAHGVYTTKPLPSHTLPSHKPSLAEPISLDLEGKEPGPADADIQAEGDVGLNNASQGENAGKGAPDLVQPERQSGGASRRISQTPGGNAGMKSAREWAESPGSGRRQPVIEPDDVAETARIRDEQIARLRASKEGKS